MNEEDEADFSIEHDVSEGKESENGEEESEDSASEEGGKKSKVLEELRQKLKVEDGGKKSKSEEELRQKLKVEEGGKKIKAETDERRQKTRCVLQEARCVLQEAPKRQRKKQKKLKKLKKIKLPALEKLKKLKKIKLPHALDVSADVAARFLKEPRVQGRMQPVKSPRQDGAQLTGAREHSLGEIKQHLCTHDLLLKSVYVQDTQKFSLVVEVIGQKRPDHDVIEEIFQKIQNKEDITSCYAMKFTNPVAWQGQVVALRWWKMWHWDEELPKTSGSEPDEERLDDCNPWHPLLP